MRRGARAVARCSGSSLVLSGCSVRKFAADQLGDALAARGSVWSRGRRPRPGRRRAAVRAQDPREPDRRVAAASGAAARACRGFVSYAAGFVEAEAERLDATEFAARSAFASGRCGCTCGRAATACEPSSCELPRAAAALDADPRAALAGVPRASVELLYWTGAAWGSASSLGLDRPELIADLPAVRAHLRSRARARSRLRSRRLHEALIALEALPPMLGGSPERAPASTSSAPSSSPAAGAPART